MRRIGAMIAFLMVFTASCNAMGPQGRSPLALITGDDGAGATR